MRLYTIQVDSKEMLALEEKDNRLYPLEGLGYAFADMNELILRATKEQIEALKYLAQAELSPGRNYGFEEVKLCAPIPRPLQDIVCLGVNYRAHVEETTHVESFQNAEATVYFSKRASLCTGCGDPIPSYSFVDRLDYEAELAVVLAKTVKNFKKEEGYGCVFGYTIINDVTARDLQMRHKQWYMGKSQDGYSPMGPCLVTADEIPDPQNLAISCLVNGEKRQSSSTKFMMQTVLGAIEELSQGMTLKAGTIIATGTPAGVALGMENPKYLQKGDVVECQIEKIGRLWNTVE